MSEVHEAVITILGVSESGKTTYMLGMYDEMRTPLNSCSLRAERDVDIALQTQWRELVGEEGKRAWPEPTGFAPIKHLFSFNVDMRKRMSVEWFDYRGGAIVDNKEGAEELKRQLRRSTCMIVAVPGEIFAEPVTGGRAARDALKRAQIGDLFQLLLETWSESNNYPPIVLMITRADVCAERASSFDDLADELVDDMKAVFQDMFKKGMRVLVCPVTLGEGLSNDLSTAEIEPKNVHKPLIFALQTYLDERLEREGEEMDSLDDRRSAVASARKSLEGWRRLFNGARVRELEEEALRLGEVHDERSADLNRLELLSARMTQELASGVAVFIDGQRVVPS